MLWRPTPSALRPAGFVEPRLPPLDRVVPNDAQWVYEIKHDGYRMICRGDAGRAPVFTRRGHDWTARVRRITEVLARPRVTSATVDREAVVTRPGDSQSGDFGG
jgi:bifunctional non-homologous end joining protein LigD